MVRLRPGSRLRVQDPETCLGFPFVFVDAIFSSSFSLIDSYIDLDAPLSEPTLVSPRLAESATPAACCCALDLAGMSVYFPVDAGASTKRDEAAHACLRSQTVLCRYIRPSITSSTMIKSISPRPPFGQ